MTLLRALPLGVVSLLACSSVPTYVLDNDAGWVADAAIATDAQVASDVAPPGLQCSKCLMFTSSWAGPGDLFGAGGVERVDALCTQLGRNIPGKQERVWKALLGTSTSTPYDRLISPPDGWYSVPQKDNQVQYKLFKSVGDMMTSPAPAALQISETGEGISEPRRVWTGGSTKPSPANCVNWTDKFGEQGVIGDPSSGKGWLEAGTEVCNAFGRVYCVEQ